MVSELNIFVHGKNTQHIIFLCWNFGFMQKALYLGSFKLKGVKMGLLQRGVVYLRSCIHGSCNNEAVLNLAIVKRGCTKGGRRKGFCSNEGSLPILMCL